MRRPLLAAAAALAVCAFALGAPASIAAEDVVLRDWETGHAVAGAPHPIVGVNAMTFGFTKDACPRVVLLDLLYDPDAGGADVEGVGSLHLLYEWKAELWGPDGLIGVRTIRASSYSFALGVAAEGAHEVRVHLALGADVSWQARIRGAAVPGEVACLDPILITEVEANPARRDAGAEWVELWNPNAVDVDVSMWVIETTHGATASHTVPVDTVVLAGARLVVVFDAGQALDNEDESVRLSDGLALLRDTTPTLSDTADDARTWQRDAAGVWTFAPATPGT